MADKKRYYAVAGVNACGFYSNYDAVLESKKYIRKFQCRRCTTLEEARCLAVDMFYDLQEGVFAGISCGTLKQVNRCYYRKNYMDHSFA